MLTYNLKLFFRRKQTFVAIVLVFSIVIIHCLLNLYLQVRDGSLIENSLTAENQIILESGIDFRMFIVLLFPVIGSLLFSDSTYSEMKSRTNLLLFNRINYKNNIMFRYFFTFIMAALVFFFAFLLEYVICLFIYQSGSYYHWIDSIGGIRYFSGDYNIFLFDVFKKNAPLYIMIILLMESFVFGALSSLAYSVSMLLKKKVIIYFVPLIATVVSGLVIKRNGYNIVAILQMIGNVTLIGYIVVMAILMIVGFFILFYTSRKKDLFL